MDLQGILAAWRRRWLTIVLVALVIHGLVAVATYLQPREYAARSQLFVSVRSGSSTSDLVSGNTFAQSQVQSYIDVVKAPVVLDPVIGELGLEESAADLSRRVTVTVPERTVILNIEVRDSDPSRAAELGEVINEQFIRRVTTLESSGSSSRDTVRVSVLRPATASARPVSPVPLRNLIIGAALGLFFGLIAALVREALDNAIRRREDVEDVSDLPILGAIPFDREAPQHPMVADTDGYSVRAEAFRALRTNLQFVHGNDRLRSVVMTSSLPGEGKTTTVANLAQVLAAQGARVCVVEGDLRRPRLLDYLGLEGGAGLTNVLIGTATLDDVIQEAGEGLHVLGAGPTPPNPSELLGSSLMERVVNLLEASHDMVLIDGPPVMPVTDSAVLSRIVGGLMVCVGFDVADRDSLARTLKSLEAVDANVVGLVLNRVPQERPGARTDYYHEYTTTVAASPPVAHTRREGRR